MTRNHIKDSAERLRAIPLKDVLSRAGAQLDQLDRAKWYTPVGIISVNGQKFFNWHQHSGGGGAIDLAMHLHALSFKDALQWLAHRFPGPVASAPPQSPRPPALRLPPADSHNLPTVMNYLSGQRRLPSRLLHPLATVGRVYADTHTNAVFLLLGKKNCPVGAELRGTGHQPWRGMAPGSRKDLGYFSITPPRPVGIILCESAIDAISCQAIHPNHLCISTAGARPNPAWLPQLIHLGLPLLCGFDADSTGDRMAHTMIGLHPAIQRLRPPAHDWNDALRAPR
jgi:hypothetical protein